MLLFTLNKYNERLTRELSSPETCSRWPSSRWRWELSKTKVYLP